MYLLHAAKVKAVLFSLGQVCRTFGTRDEKRTRKNLLGTWHSLLSQIILLLLPDQVLHIVHNMCVCVCVCACVYRCPGGNVPDFGRMFLTLKYTDITQNTYVYPKLNGYGDNGERSLNV